MAWVLLKNTNFVKLLQKSGELNLKLTQLMTLRMAAQAKLQLEMAKAVQDGQRKLAKVEPS